MGRLHYAARRGLLAEVEAAIANGEPLDEPRGSGLTPLHIACQEGFTKIVRALLDAGADPLLPHPNGRTALHFAAGSGHLNVVKELVSREVPVDLGTGRGNTPASEAAVFNYRETVEYLLQQGADPQAKGQGKTIAEWLEVGGIQGLHQSHFPLKTEGTERDVEGIRRMMAQAPSVEEYAARHGRTMVIFGLDQYSLPDVEADRWAKRFGEIIRSPKLLAECEDRYLSGDERLQVQKRRERVARATVRREARLQDIERRRTELA